MAFNKPTFSEILARVQGDFRAEQNTTNVLRRSVEYVFSRVIAGVAYLLYGYLDWIYRQCFPDTADTENLIRFAARYGITQLPATYFLGKVLFTGESGTTIPAGTRLQRSDGAAYQTDAVASIPAFVAGVSQVSRVTTVADSAGSLNSKYFFLDAPNQKYTFFFNVNGAGSDPLISGRISVEVAVSTNATANTVATALQTAANAQTDLTATVSTNVVTITNDATGAVTALADGALPTGFTLLVLTAGVTTVLKNVTVSVTSELSGASQNMLVNDVVGLITPISGVNSQATVTAVTAQASDIESQQNLLTRLFSRLQQPPLGGSVNDYKSEALKVAGVTRVWVFPQFLGTGTVGIFFVLDGATNIFPDAGKITEVQTALDLFKPVTCDLTCYSPTAYPMNPTINLNPNNATVRAAVVAALNDLLLQEAHVRGAYKGYQTTYDGKILLSRINEAISVAAGEVDHVLVSPVANVVPDANGKIVTLGSITWGTLV